MSFDFTKHKTKGGVPQGPCPVGIKQLPAEAYIVADDDREDRIDLNLGSSVDHSEDTDGL